MTLLSKTATSISINIVRVLPTARLILDAFAASQRASRVTARALDSNQTFLARVQTDRRRLRMSTTMTNHVFVRVARLSLDHASHITHTSALRRRDVTMLTRVPAVVVAHASRRLLYG